MPWYYSWSDCCVEIAAQLKSEFVLRVGGIPKIYHAIDDYISYTYYTILYYISIEVTLDWISANSRDTEQSFLKTY